MRRNFRLSWSDEFAGFDLGDKRVNRRFIQVLNDFTKDPAAPILKASQSWAGAKGAYRLMDQEKFSSEKVWAHHAEQSLERMRSEDVVLLLSDTTVLNFQSHLALKGAGRIGKKLKGAGESAGFYVHTILAVTPERVPLGILDQKLWTRDHGKEKKGTNRLSYMVPFLEKESSRWAVNLERGLQSVDTKARQKFVVVSDRESDINAYLGSNLESGVHFVVRGSKCRKEFISSERIHEFMQARPVAGTYDLTVVQRYKPSGDMREPKVRLLEPLVRKAKIQVRFSEVILSVADLQENKRPERLYCIYVSEECSDVDYPIDWILLTNLPITNFKEAKKVIGYYSTRWLIEVFHKMLKTNGCRIEDCLLQTKERVERYLTMESLVALKLTQLTYYHRFAPSTPCTKIVDDITWKALVGYVKKTRLPGKKAPTAAEFTVMIAKLGGYPARSSDPPPGPLVLRRGWEKLGNIVEAYEMWCT